MGSNDIEKINIQPISHTKKKKHLLEQSTSWTDFADLLATTFFKLCQDILRLPFFSIKQCHVPENSPASEISCGSKISVKIKFMGQKLTGEHLNKFSSFLCLIFTLTCHANIQIFKQMGPDLSLNGFIRENKGKLDNQCERAYFQKNFGRRLEGVCFLGFAGQEQKRVWLDEFLAVWKLWW